MAERKRLAASFEASDDYLPDFRDITKQGEESIRFTHNRGTDNLGTMDGHLVTSLQDAEIVANLEKFRKILQAQSCDVLLLELAVVHERKLARANLQSGPLVAVDKLEEQYFTSHIVSYLGRINEQSLLIKAWNKAIVSKLLTQSEKGRFSPMAYKETYESSLLTEQFNWAVAEIRRSRISAPLTNLSEAQAFDLDNVLVEARNDVLGHIKRIHEKLNEVFWATSESRQTSNDDLLADYVKEAQVKAGLSCSPTVFNNTYKFSLIETDDSRPVENTISYLVSGVISNLVSNLSTSDGGNSVHLKVILDFLMNCCLLVVPFRRPIAFATSAKRTDEDEFAWGDQPGGCLFAIIRPSLGGMVEEKHLEDLARRLSLALSRAALRESHVTAKQNIDKDDDLRIVTHHIPSSIKEVRSNLKNALSHLESPDADLTAIRRELNIALERSDKLHYDTEVVLHAHKVDVGAETPRRFAHSTTPEQLHKEISTIANQRWQRLTENAHTEVIPVSLRPGGGGQTRVCCMTRLTLNTCSTSCCGMSSNTVKNSSFPLSKSLGH